jgi:AICAR transformylase/IMP cyclohydrolase PurH
VLGFTRAVDLASAEFLVSENRFVEAILAPSFEPDALERLKTGAKWGKNVRLLACGPLGTGQKGASSLEVKPLRGGFLLQERDLALGGEAKLEPVTKAKATQERLINCYSLAGFRSQRRRTPLCSRSRYRYLRSRSALSSGAKEFASLKFSVSFWPQQV